MLNYYVYYWLRKNNSKIAKAGTPYYVGKGKGKRAYRKGGPKDQSNIVLIATDLYECEAFEMEVAHIKMWGRIDKKTGILRNRTDGGEGGDNSINIDYKKRKSDKGRKDPPETKARKKAAAQMRVANMSVEDREAAVARFKGKTYEEIYGTEDAVKRIQKLKAAIRPLTTEAARNSQRLAWQRRKANGTDKASVEKRAKTRATIIAWHAKRKEARQLVIQ